jgi:ketosteroid isomerase-like protein
MSRLTKPPLFSSPAECEQAFYDALDAADAEAVLDLWLDDHDVCCVHPGGPRLLGFAAVAASWRAILGNGPVQIRAGAVKALETPTVAVHNVVEEIVIAQGRSQRVVQVLATNVFVKTAGGWKMVLHHASGAPEGQPSEVEVPNGTLH